MKSRHLEKYMPEVITGVTGDVGSRSNAAYLDRRDAERVPIGTDVFYVTDERLGCCRGQGQLGDLSKTGCKIIGPAPPAGTTVTLVLDLEDDKDPLCISGATVTWTQSESFGVRFPKLRSEERQRLQWLVLRYATFRGRSQKHAAFRLA
jgi:PilZ domain-containing protein